MSEETKNKVMGKINEIKSNIETFISDVNVKDLKKSFNLMIKDAQKDFKGIVERDLESVRKKLQKEKQDFELKAKKFLEGHKKELSNLQEKLDKLIKSSTKIKVASVKTTSKKATSKKNVVKKVTKALAKPGFKSKASKKVATKK